MVHHIADHFSSAVDAGTNLFDVFDVIISS